MPRMFTAAMPVDAVTLTTIGMARSRSTGRAGRAYHTPRRPVQERLPRPRGARAQHAPAGLQRRQHRPLLRSSGAPLSQWMRLPPTDSSQSAILWGDAGFVC